MFSLAVVLPLSIFWRVIYKLWSKLLHASLSLVFGHLILDFRTGFSGVPFVGSLLQCFSVMLTLWAVLLLMQILLGRLVFLCLTSCNGGISSTVELDLAMIPPCLTCYCSISLHLITATAFCLALVDLQADIGCH